MQACEYCLHPGENIGGTVKYPRKTGLEKRTKESHLRAMAEGPSAEAPVDGYVGRSNLVDIPGFDIIQGLPVDIMHCCYLGYTLFLQV